MKGLKVQKIDQNHLKFAIIEARNKTVCVDKMAISQGNISSSMHINVIYLTHQYASLKNILVSKYFKQKSEPLFQLFKIN